MSKLLSKSRLLVVAVCCVAVGAAASAIAVAGATTSSSHPAATKSAKVSRASWRRHHRLRSLATRAVQGSAVVYTKSGWETVTFERGKVDSVSGQQLTLTEGTPKASYKTVTLTIPSTAVVRDNRQKTSLSSVKPGQRVFVLQTSKRTAVVARNAK